MVMFNRYMAIITIHQSFIDESLKLCKNICHIPIKGTVMQIM